MDARKHQAMLDGLAEAIAERTGPAMSAHDAETVEALSRAYAAIAGAAPEMRTPPSAVIRSPLRRYDDGEF